ncbi:MAG TPA: ABC transporter ATP-binding protein [Bellilinea sp.]|nr:ABC transporter ATP-binding protein [Bellilinea sp.]
MATSQIEYFDLRKAVGKNRLIGLWRALQGYHLHYLGANISLGVAALAKTSVYLLLRYFVDHNLIANDQTYPIPLIALGFLLLAGVEGTFSFLSGILASQSAEGVIRRFRNFFFDHIQRLTFTFHSRTETGDLIQRSTSDTDAVRRFYSEQGVGIGRIAFIFIINFIALLNLNTQLALISIIVVPVILLTSLFFFKKLTKIYEKFQEQDAIVSTRLQENLTGVRVVKAFARQDYEIGKFDIENKEKYRRGVQLSMMHSLFWPLSDTICNIQIIGGLLLAGTLAIKGTISVGDFLAYSGLIAWIIYPLRNLGRLIVQTSTALVSFDRIMKIVREEQEPLTTGSVLDTPLKGNITFKNVTFAYEDGNNALDDVSFHCEAGWRVALLGSTGSGKTTLVNLLPRFYDYDSGSIQVDGHELNTLARVYLRQNIGIIEQEPFLFSRTIRENISYGVERPVTEAEVIAAAKAASIHDSIISFEHGYDTIVGEKGVTLSGGQKQRVAIARTLLKNPKILIMDDSTSAIDADTEQQIREALESLMVDRTTFIIAHKIQSVRDADLILVMEDGRITQSGTHSELVQLDGMYKRIFDIQTSIDAELEKEISYVR